MHLTVATRWRRGGRFCYNVAVQTDLEADAPAGFRWDRMSAAVALGYCVLVAALSIGSVLGELRQQFHLSGFVAALHGSTFGFGLLLAGCFGVGFVDRVGRRSALALSAGTMIVGIASFCLGPSWPVTLFGAALGGLGGALLVMVMPGLVSDHYGEHRAAAFAALNGVPGLAGVAFGLSVGLALGFGWSWRLPYLILTSLFAGALAIVAWPVPLPETTRHGRFTLAHFRNRDVFVPWLYMVNAVLTEFTVGIWATTYLKEVGRASGGMAAAAGGSFGVAMFVSRLVMPRVMAVTGSATVPLGFLVVGAGALLMCFGPGLAVETLGVVAVGFGGGPLYPLTVDRLYARAEGAVDSISLGAICALASGVAVVLGPLATGVLADAFTLRWAILVVPVLACIGAITQRHAHE
jgi:MFS family permease